MKVITRAEIFDNFDFFVNEIASGKVFVYPTDTIYGIGCNARIHDSVLSILEAKQRSSKPMSVIAPNLEWVEANCRVNNFIRSYLKKLPGPYTFVLLLKNKSAVDSSVNNNLDSLGIRMIDSWFQDLVSKSMCPFVTTSVNISSLDPITKISDIPSSMECFIDYAVDDGALSNPSSSVIDLTEETKKVLR